MTHKIFQSVLLLASIFSFSACQQNTTQESSTTDSTAVASGPAISLSPVDNSEDFPNAQLSMSTPIVSAKGDSVTVTFQYNVKNYDLKAQTSDSVKGLCSNSGQGQHIHFILDNQPYVALYDPKHEVTLPKNSEHYLLSFLSRSYHMSLKNKGAAVLAHFKIDENGKFQSLDIPSTPMVFYSRPKGDYLGNDTKNILLDFYVWNTTLGSNNKVRATIKSGDKDTSLEITDWKPYFLQNLAMGKNSITLTMLDASGNKVEGDNTEVTRDFNLSQSEPMQP